MLITDLEKHINVRKSAVHVGGHTGEEADWYAKLGFTSVIWFEPNQGLYNQLCQNLIKYENQVAYPFGIHDTLKEAALHESNNLGLSSSILDLGTHKQHHPDVRYLRDLKIKLFRLDDFFKRFGVCDDFNFLNIDVQGVELNVIKSLGERVNQFDYIYTEVNEEHLYKDCCLVGEIDAYLSEFGFVRELTKMTKAHWGDALYVKK